MKIKRQLIIKNCKLDFGLGVGVIAKDEVIIRKRPKMPCSDWILARQLEEINRAMIDDNVEVICVNNKNLRINSYGNKYHNC